MTFWVGFNFLIFFFYSISLSFYTFFWKFCSTFFSKLSEFFIQFLIFSMSKSTFFPLYCFMNPIYSLTSLKILIMVGFFFFWFSSAPYNFLYFSLFPIFVFILKAFLKCLVILGYQFTFENEAPKNYSMLYICGRLKIATDRSSY